MTWRFIAQRAVTKEFLDWDLPLDLDEMSWELSGPGALRATITPDVGQLRATDGGLLLEEWGTLLYAEADGVIRWGGILISSGFEDEDWTIEAAGFAAYPSGIPYLGNFAKVGVDPVECFKEVWRHVQSYPAGNLDVTITGTAATPVRLGVPAVKPFTEVNLDKVWQPITAANTARVVPSAKATLAAPMTTSSTTLSLSALDHFGSISYPCTVSVGNEDIRIASRSGLTLAIAARGFNKTSVTEHYKGTSVTFEGTPTRTNAGDPAEPYQLVYWEAPDCGDELRSLATEAPFDFVEHHSWDGDNIRHEIEVGYPRVGRRRDDLAFVQGDNVTDVVSFESTADDYANEVVGIGSGEGRATLRRSTAVVDGRLRRTAVHTDKAVKTSSRMDAFIAGELGRRRGLLQITSVDVVDHPNATLASWQVGDDILIRADVPWLGSVDLWCRITGWALTGEHTARLTLARSDSFTYGG